MTSSITRRVAALSFALLACGPDPVDAGTDTDAEDGGGDETAASDTEEETSTGDTSSGDGDTSSGDGDTSTGDGDTTTGGCSLGEQGCECFANQTCFTPHLCVNGMCGCDAGTEGCTCMPGGACLGGLMCSLGGICQMGGSSDMIECGTGLECPIANEGACCWDTYLSEGAPQGECVVGATAVDGCATQEDGTGHETRIECQGSSYCTGGQACCGELYDSPMGQNYMTVTCEASCGSFTVCANDFECPVGEQCSSSNYLPTGYGFCN